MRLFLSIAAVVCATVASAQIETDSEDNEAHPFEQFQENVRREAVTRYPFQERWTQGGQPGFLNTPSPRVSEIETDTQNIQSEPLEELEEAERREAAQEKKGEISLTGDVRLKWIPQYKKNYGYITRGSAASNPVQVTGAKASATLPVGTPLAAPMNYFEGEFNLYADYDAGLDWAEAQVRFKNVFGIDSGSSTSVALKKAWIGYSFYEDPCTEFYVELGKKGLSNIFDSRIQFDNVFDGILFVYTKDMGHVGELKVDGGPFIVDFRTNHYAWAAEIDIEKIACTGLFAKYSYIHWRKKGVDRYGVFDTPNYRFVNSQFMLGYNFCPDVIGCNVAIYGAYLINHAAMPVVSSAYRRENRGWYAAVEWGKLGKKGDWLIDLCYQEVGAQAVSNIDMSGIGRGNSTSRGDTAAVANPFDPNLYTVPTSVNTVPASQVEGNNNYRGVEVRTYYGLTDRITIKGTADYSVPKLTTIGGSNRFLKYEVEVRYDF